ncbi:MAG TPA: pseudouridine synthase [Anaerolineaceae bacterium]
MEERLQKILARAGFGSRRSCEEIILAGRVRVNGNVAQLGSKADSEKDQITLDFKPIPRQVKPVYIALHKPQGVLSDTNPKDDPRPTVLDFVPSHNHLFSVGRLDFDSEGLILLTNDGDLANRLTHPRYEHEKEYRVLVIHRPDEKQLEILRRGVVLADGYRTAPADVRVEQANRDGAWLRIVLREGKKRQIREMGERIGLPVDRIIRVRIGILKLGDLKPGEWRYLTSGEIRELQGIAARSQPRKSRSMKPRREIPGKSEKKT